MTAISTNSLFMHATAALLAAAPFLAAGAFVFSLLALVTITAFERRLSHLLLGRSGSFEETIAILSRDMKEMHSFRAELEKYLKLSETRLRGSIQGVGVVRFNPYQDSNGGNQSFAAAFLDAYGNGVVFSSLYARDRVGVYAKPLEKNTSTYELSVEEQEAIEKALTSLNAHKKDII